MHVKASDREVCTWCGTVWVGGMETGRCEAYDKRPRQRPPSIFANLGDIGELMKAIQKAEGRVA